MKAVILCGGEGTRLREETEFKPKPMVNIGGIPLLVHIMKIYSYYGVSDFILCLGYKGEMIKKFFLEEYNLISDFELKFRNGKSILNSFSNDIDDLNIIFANTGLKAQTGSRIKKIEKYIDEDDFYVTYGDGVSDININELYDFYKKEGKSVVLTGVHPRSKYGSMEFEGNTVTKFVEKPILKDYINGGFYVFNKKIFDYLSSDDNCVLETSAFTKLADEKDIAVYRHNGFWFSVDTYKEYLSLNEMYDKGIRPWMRP